jgi:aminoacrylate peracid reductase
VESAGGALSDIAYNMIFLKNKADYAAFNEVYAEFFGDNPPARYCIVCDLVRDEFLVEISSVAHLGPSA